MNQRRHGVVLLWTVVLVSTVMVLVGSACALWSQTQRLHQAQDLDRLTDDLRRAGESIAVAWLTRHAGQALLPPEGGGILLTHDAWSTPQGTAGVAVAVYDLLAAIPVRAARESSDLRGGIPPPWSASLATSDPGDHIEAWLTAVAIDPTSLRFPQLHWSDLESATRTGCEVQPLRTVVRLSPPGRSLCECLDPWDTALVNVNTADDAVIHALCSPPDAEAVLARRRAGLAAPIVPVTAAALQAGISLTSSSDRWAALIAVRSGTREQAWWVTYRLATPAPIVMQRYLVTP